MCEPKKTRNFLEGIDILEKPLHRSRGNRAWLMVGGRTVDAQSREPDSDSLPCSLTNYNVRLLHHRYFTSTSPEREMLNVFTLAWKRAVPTLDS